MDSTGFKKFIEKQSWIFAKTYADKAPHEYIVRNNIVGEDAEFLEAVQYIHDNGFTMHFNGGYPNKYIYLDGFNYWVMMYGKNDPTGIINRSIAKDYWVDIEWKPAKRQRKKEERERMKNGNNLQGN